MANIVYICKKNIQYLPFFTNMYNIYYFLYVCHVSLHWNCNVDIKITLNIKQIDDHSQVNNIATSPLQHYTVILFCLIELHVSTYEPIFINEKYQSIK